MVSVRSSGAIDRGFGHGQIKQILIKKKKKKKKKGFVASPLSTHNEGGRAKHGWFEIGIMCQSGATFLHTDCSFSELALYKSN